jgi:integrase/recombinase XerD
VTHLRKLMLEELERRNYSQNTVRTYLMTIEDFARYFHKPPDTLGPEHVREYQAYLFRERKLAANTVNQRVGALRFFFIKTLKKNWSVEETPYPKRVIRLPKILSPEEVARLIDSATTPFYRTILMTLYATGLRRAELTHLKISDIDSQRMVIHVEGGKGRKDRDVMLSPKLLEALREHFRGLKRKPKVWLFPGNRWHTADHPITTKIVWLACREAATRAGIRKEVHPHTLRHCFRHPPARSRRRFTDHPDSTGPSRSGRDYHLPPPFPAASERYGQPARRSASRRQAQKRRRHEVNAEAAHRGGRCDPRSRRKLLRVQPEMVYLATSESAPRNPALPHRRTRRTRGCVFKMRTYGHLLQLLQKPALSKMPG